MANPTIIRLQDGNVMPQLGLGVWKASNEEVIAAIHKALEVAIDRLIPPQHIRMKKASAKR